MSVTVPEQPPTTTALDTAYLAQRARLTSTVLAATAATWGALHTDRSAAAARAARLVTAGQGNVARLVDAYMAAKSRVATGRGNVKGIDTTLYTVATLRRGGLTAVQVYERAVRVHDAALLKDSGDPAKASESGLAELQKLAATDLQLAQTHAARDIMQADTRIVGWRRVLTGPSSCPLCTAASTRTYRISDLMPIHEHCDCAIEPLWGTEAVASVGTTVRVEDDPELGPRLMAESWSSVGPRLL